MPPKASFSAVKKIGLACNLNQVVDTVPLEEINILVNDFTAELHILKGISKNLSYDAMF